MKEIFIRNLVIAIAVILIIYALADSINNYNALGVFLALGGFGALCAGIYLYSQMKLQQETIEEEEE